MSVVEALSAELERMPADVAESALAATALVLAEQLDDGHTSATSKSMCSRELREALGQLRALAPPEKKADGIDNLRDEVAAKRAALGRAAP